MANEKIYLVRNTGTEESPIWEKLFPMTNYDAVKMSEEDGSENIKEYIDRQFAQTGIQSIKVGDTEYTNKDGIAALPAYPTTLPASDVYVWAKSETKPKYTYSEVGADKSGSASDALVEAKTYTDTKVAAIFDEAPETLDTIKEITDLLQENDTMIDTLNAAIGNKANKSDIYTPGAGLVLSGTTLNHSNSVEAGTAQGDATKTLTFGGTFTIPVINYDAQGHITGVSKTTMTMPLNTEATTAKAYVTGVTTANSNKQVYDPKVYLGDVEGQLVAEEFIGDLTGNADTATKLATPINISLSSDFQGSASFDGSGDITINAYNYSASVGSHNKSNYPWHRVAYKGSKAEPITGTYQDSDMILAIKESYHGGGYGIVKISLRTQANGTESIASANWIVRHVLKSDDLKIGLYNVSGSTYADVFLKTGTYARTAVYQLQGGRAWTLVSSEEVSNTTTADALSSYECYTDIETAGTELHSQSYTNIIDSVEAGNVAVAIKASQDADGQDISSTYIKGLSVSGKVITYTKGDDTTGTITTKDTTYSAATTSVAGLMSATDKAKLDSIEEGANAYTYTLPAAGSSLGGVKSGGDVTISSGVITVKDDSHNHTIANVDNLQTTLDAKVPTTRTINSKALSADITLTAEDVGADSEGSAVSALTAAKSYTDTKISSLINSAPTTLDTLGEIATAMEENADVVAALEESVGGKQATITGAATTITSSNLTASRALISNSSGKVAVSAITSTELGYLDGVTSNIQTQLDGKAASSHGTHVTFSTTTPVVAGTAAVGTATTVSRSDHVHPAQTNVSGNAGTATKLKTARTIDGVSFDGSAAITHYGTCSTAAATAAKTVDLAGFSLVTGATVKVKFTVTNTASSPTLNVNSTGAKNIMYRGSAISAGYLAANRVYEFVYDGTDWELVGDINSDSNTKNTAGSTDSSSKLFLIGATSQAANPQTYSHDTAYVGTDGCLYSNSTKVSVEGHTHDYVPLSGNSTIVTTSFQGLTLKRNNTGGSALQYSNTSKTFGNVGFLQGGDFVVNTGTNTNGNVLVANGTTATFPGTVVATTFSGSGASLASLNASNISSGTLAAARLATSGVTAGDYGFSATNTSEIDLTGVTHVNIPNITVDKYGRVTGAETVKVTLPTMTGASTSLAGTAGFVPAPGKGNQSKFLKGDGTWATPTNTTYSTMGAATSSADGTSGLVPAPVAGAQAKFLRGDGTWQTPTNTKNTAGSTDSSSKLFLVGATSQASSATTYSHDTAYVGTDGHVYSNSKQVVNLSDSQALTNKTYDGYTLADACARGVDATPTYGSTNLITSGAMHTHHYIGDGMVASGMAGSISNHKYGHVALSDSYTSSSGAATSAVGASSKAVYDCYTALSNSMCTYETFTEGNNTNRYIQASGSTGSILQLKAKRFTATLSGTSDITINTGIDTSNIYDIRAIAYNTTSDVLFPLPSVGHSSVDSGHTSYDIAMYVASGGVIHIKPYSDRSGFAALITIYYI